MLGLALATFVAAIAQVVTGFGFAVVAAPFFVVVLGTAGGLQLAVILNGLLSGVMAWRLRGDVDWPLLGRLVPASLPGLALGAVAYRHLDNLHVRVAMG